MAKDSGQSLCTDWPQKCLSHDDKLSPRWAWSRSSFFGKISVNTSKTVCLHRYIYNGRLMLLSDFVSFCEQSIDYSISDENLTLWRVETWTVVALKEYVKCGLPVTGRVKEGPC